MQTGSDRAAAFRGTEVTIDKTFRTRDGFIEISPVFSDSAVRGIFTAVRIGDLSQKPEFRTEELQIKNREQLNAQLAEAFQKNHG